jgi:hypothetical protein
MMKKAYLAMMLVSIASSWVPAAVADVGSFDSGQNAGSTYGVTPNDFLEQADGCPYAATAMYQQYVMQRQQQDIQRLQQTAAGTSMNARSDFSDSSAGWTKATAGKNDKKVIRTAKKTSSLKKAGAPAKAESRKAVTSRAKVSAKSDYAQSSQSDGYAPE